MRYPICLNTNTYNGYPLADAVDGAVRAGIRLVELSAVSGCQHVGREMSEPELRAVVGTLGEHGLTAVALGGSANLRTPAGRLLFRRNLELGARLGVSYVVTGTGERHGDTSRIEEPSTLVRGVGELARIAAALGLRMAIETHGATYATGAQLLELLREVDEPALAINYDTANTIFYGDTDPYDDLAGCLDQVIGIHLKDKSGARDEWNFPAVGLGDTDFTRIASILLGQSRQGCVPLSIEVEFTPAGASDLAEIHRSVQVSAETVRALW